MEDTETDLDQAHLTLTLNARVAEIPDALDRVEAFFQAQDADPQVVYSFRLALDELMTNAVMHGFPDGGAQAHDLRLDLTVQPDRQVRCELVDDGVAFDPTRVAAPDTEASLDERSIGGLGLHLVRQMIPRFEYRRDNARNVVRLSGPLRASES